MNEVTSLEANSCFAFSVLMAAGSKARIRRRCWLPWKRRRGRRCVEQFDLITGTSTGGIIALGLGLGKSAQEIVEFYREHGPQIFPGTSLVERTTGLWRQLWGPKHSHDVLRKALTQVLGDKRPAGGPDLRRHRRAVVSVECRHITNGSSTITRHWP